MSGNLPRDHAGGDWIALITCVRSVLRLTPGMMLFFSFVVPGAAAANPSLAGQRATAPKHDSVSNWRIDYHRARSAAIDAKKNLLIHFVDIRETARHHRFVTNTCYRSDMRPLLENFVVSGIIIKET